MTRILSDAELIELTGYEKPGKQLESLRALGLQPVIRPDGRPRVTDDAVTRAICGDLGQSHRASEPVAAAPNWSALRRSG